MNVFDSVIVLCTAPNEIIARDLAKKALLKQLVGCVTILPGAISLYRWKDKLEQTSEVQMLLKTNLVNQPSLFDFLKTNHPYQIPELLALQVVRCDNDYLSWLKKFLS